MKAITPRFTSVDDRDAEPTRSSSLIFAGFEQTRRRWRYRFKRALGSMRAFWRNVRGVMREIADENAYARHLAWHGTTHSPEEYRRFADHRLAAKYKRAKCC